MSLICSETRSLTVRGSSAGKSSSGGSRSLILWMLNCFQMYCACVSLRNPARLAANVQSNGCLIRRAKTRIGENGS